MFNITARPYVPMDVLTFAAPMGKFTAMVENMESSFLTTKTWAKVQERIGQGIGHLSNEEKISMPYLQLGLMRMAPSLHAL